jgi:ferritin-like metal-binding protein YciE
MTANDPREVFLVLLSNVREGEERASNVYDEIGKAAENPDIKEVLEARAFLKNSITERLDQCFKLLGEKPMPLPGRLRETFIEDFREQLKEIESPVARRLFALAKIVHFAHFRIGEYLALTAAADLTGNHGVGLLLESCLADTLAFVERDRRLLRHLAEERVAETVGFMERNRPFLRHLAEERIAERKTA